MRSLASSLVRSLPFGLAGVLMACGGSVVSEGDSRDTPGSTDATTSEGDNDGDMAQGEDVFLPPPASDGPGPDKVPSIDVGMDSRSPGSFPVVEPPDLTVPPDLAVPPVPPGVLVIIDGSWIRLSLSGTSVLRGDDETQVHELVLEPGGGQLSFFDAEGVESRHEILGGSVAIILSDCEPYPARTPDLESCHAQLSSFGLPYEWEREDGSVEGRTLVHQMTATGSAFRQGGFGSVYSMDIVSLLTDISYSSELPVLYSFEDPTISCDGEYCEVVIESVH